MTHISKLNIKFAIKKSIALMSSKIIERKSYIVNKSFRSYLTATIDTGDRSNFYYALNR